MFRTGLDAIMIAALAVIATASAATAGQGSMPLSGPTAPPIGHVQFCDEYRDECARFGSPNQVVRLTQSAYDRLEVLNEAVNRAVLPATDMEIYGEVERWAFPLLSGDCEDYVLEKRRLLAESGWPESALLITVVRDETGDGHAVLTVRTDRGDLILDNKSDEILLWDVVPYQFIKRQSARDAAQWVGIEDGRTVAVGSLR